MNSNEHQMNTKTEGSVESVEGSVGAPFESLVRRVRSHDHGSMAVLLEFLLCPEALLHPSELMGQTQNSSTGSLQLPAPWTHLQMETS